MRNEINLILYLTGVLISTIIGIVLMNWIDIPFKVTSPIAVGIPLALEIGLFVLPVFTYLGVVALIMWLRGFFVLEKQQLGGKK